VRKLNVCLLLSGSICRTLDMDHPADESEPWLELVASSWIWRWLSWLFCKSVEAGSLWRVPGNYVLSLIVVNIAVLWECIECLVQAVEAIGSLTEINKDLVTASRQLQQQHGALRRRLRESVGRTCISVLHSSSSACTLYSQCSANNNHSSQL